MNLVRVALIAALSLAASAAPVWAQGQRQLNLLCWVSYEERTMLEPFEKKYNVRVKYKTFLSDDQAYALLLSSPRQFDVVVTGPEYVEKLHRVGKLAPLDPKDYDFKDYFKPFQKFPLCWFDNKLYAVIVRFGANALVYNTKHLSAKDVESYDVLWSPKMKGKVGIWDWYLPSMGTLSRAMGNTGNSTDISNQKYHALEKRLMELRPQVGAIFGSPAEMDAAMANEQVWLVPGAGEWVAAGLKEQGKPVDWALPPAGGQMWIESLSIPIDAPHPDLAKQFVQWMQTPAAQKLLSQRKAYHSNVPNKKAYDLMSAQQKDALKIHNEDEAVKMVSRLSIRHLPAQQPETEWQAAWQRFKAAK
jgi:spermidine/putrescine transport system substrate-binding protein